MATLGKRRRTARLNRWRDSNPTQCGHCAGYTHTPSKQQLEILNALAKRTRAPERIVLLPCECHNAKARKGL